MRVDRDTVKAYDDNVDFFVRRFDSVPARVGDIMKAQSLYSGSSESVSALEIGCGSGRDAAVIVKTVDEYEGIDPSAELLKVAKRRCPEGSFLLSSALDFNYPIGLDYVYAFASLVHCSKEELAEVFSRVAVSLVEGGIFYASFRYASIYHEEIDTLAGGRRKYFYYEEGTLRNLAHGLLEVVYVDSSTEVLGLGWINMAFRR